MIFQASHLSSRAINGSFFIYAGVPIQPPILT
jgi:hypothetical protein